MGVYEKPFICPLTPSSVLLLSGCRCRVLVFCVPHGARAMFSRGQSRFLRLPVHRLRLAFHNLTPGVADMPAIPGTPSYRRRGRTYPTGPPRPNNSLSRRLELHPKQALRNGLKSR